MQVAVFAGSDGEMWAQRQNMKWRLNLGFSENVFFSDSKLDPPTPDEKVNWKSS